MILFSFFYGGDAFSGWKLLGKVSPRPPSKLFDLLQIRLLDAEPGALDVCICKFVISKLFLYSGFAFFDLASYPCFALVWAD
jgi:hypothetical protein